MMLEEAVYIPTCKINLFSITQANSAGATVTIDYNAVKIILKNVSLKFDYRIKR